MSTTDFDRKDALKDLDTFFDKDQRILLHQEDLDKLQDTAKYTWSQIEQLKENPAAFEESPNNITNTGRVDAAFTDERGTTFLFSGNEYFAYTDEYDIADAGHPRPISSNDRGFPQVSQINAAFHVRGETFFFHNGGETFSTSQDPHTFLSVRERFGRSENVLDHPFITAAFTVNHHSYLVGRDTIIRYENSDYSFVEKRFQIQNDLFDLLIELDCVNNQRAFHGKKITAACRNGDVLLFDVQGLEDLAFDLQTNVISEFNDPTNSFALFEHDGLIYRFTSTQLERIDGTTIETVPLARPINAALSGLDDHIYLFSDDEFIFIPKSQIDLATIDNSIQDWDNRSVNILQKWGKVSETLLGHTGRVDAAFVDFDRVYLFSGEDYTRYSFDRRSRGLSEFPDRGYPQRIRGNRDFLPQLNQIDAAFRGFDGRDYFFNNQDQIFVTRNEPDAPRNTANDWGKTKVHAEKPDGEVVGAAFMYENFTYLLTEREIIKYENGDDGFISLAEEAFLENRMKRLFEIQHAHLITNFDRIHSHLNAIEEQANSFGTETNQRIEHGFDVQHAQLITGIDQVRTDIQNSQSGLEQGFDIHHAHLITGFDRVQSEVQHSINQISLGHEKHEVIEQQLQEGFQQVDNRLLQLSVPDLNLPLLHQVEERITGRGDGRISEADAEEIIAFANMVGDDEVGVIDESEMKTIAFIIAKYNVTDAAKKILVAAL